VCDGIRRKEEKVREMIERREEGRERERGREGRGKGGKHLRNRHKVHKTYRSSL